VVSPDAWRSPTADAVLSSTGRPPTLPTGSHANARTVTPSKRVERVPYANRADSEAAYLRALLNVAGCGTVVLAILTNRFIGPLTPLTVVAFIPLFIILNRYRFAHVIASAGPYLLLPLFALFSVIWSQSPGNSLRYGLYYLSTVVVGSLIGAGMRSQEALKGLSLGLLISGILNFMLGGYSVIETGEPAFRGIQGSKNTAGEIAGAAMLISLAMFCQAWIKRETRWVLFAGFGLAIAAITLILSKATGALIGSAVAMCCMVCWLFSMRMNRQWRTAIFVVVMAIVGVMLLTLDFWLPPLFELLLESSGKDAGLTGRDILWLEADEQIAARPWLGGGYNAFWVQGNLEAERLWDEMGIQSRAGFSFHNTFKEILVDLGYVGLVIFALIGLASTFVLLIRTMFTPTISLVMASALIVYFAIKLPFETFGYGGMHLLSMLVYTCWAMGYSSLLNTRQR
jgi:exopolysaccharide production protein ExoQ